MRGTSPSAIAAPTPPSRPPRPESPWRRRAGVLVLALAVAAPAVPAAAVEVNRIVLRVNSRILTLYDYQLRKAEQISAISRANIPAERKQEFLARVGEAVMRELFEEMLLLSRADMLGLEVSEEALDDAVERAKESFGIESEEDFDRALAESGLTREEMRERMGRTLRLQQVVAQDVRPRIQLGEEDARRYYQSHPEEFQLPVRWQVRELVVLDSSGLPAAEMDDLAADLAARVAAGTLGDEEIAGYSEQGLTTRWIELGWVQPGDLAPELEAVLAELDSGQSSAPVRARGGLHILQVVERKEPEQLAFAEVADQIRARETDRLFSEEMDEYLEELAAESYIVSRPPPEAADFRVAGQRAPADPLTEFGLVPEATEPPAPPEQ